MAKFCNKCGSPVSGPFCGKCGSDTRVAGSPQPQLTPQPPLPPQPQPEQLPPSPAVTPALVYAAPQPPVSSAPVKKSPLGKILIVVAVVVIGISALAVGGTYYVVHRVKEKVHEVINGTTSDDSSTSDTTSSGGDPCRYLSKEDVGQAIGVEIAGTNVDGESCRYLAKGNRGEMSAKHAAKMLGAKGADANTHKMIQNFAQGVFSSILCLSKSRIRAATLPATFPSSPCLCPSPRPRSQR